MQQLTAMLPKVTQPVPKFNPKRIWDTLPTTVTHVNPEVETFLMHNPVEAHAATRLRALPPHFQSVVLSRGSIFGGRDPTAVLLGRIRNACRGITNPYEFVKPGDQWLGILPPAGFSGTTASVNPQDSTSSARPAENSGGDAPAQQLALQDGNSQDMSDGKKGAYGTDGSGNSSWVSMSMQGNSESSSRSNREYRQETPQADFDSQRKQELERKRREKDLERKQEQVREAAAELSEARALETAGAVTPVAKDTKGNPAAKGSAATRADVAKKQAAVNGAADEDPHETPAERKKREEMQMSIAGTLASLASKFLNKDTQAKFAGLSKDSEKGDGSDEDMEIDNDAGAGSRSDAALPGARVRVQPPKQLNPFRSKVFTAPVSVSPPRDSPLAMDLPLLRIPPQTQPEIMPMSSPALEMLEAGSTAPSVAPVPLGIARTRVEDVPLAGGPSDGQVGSGDVAQPPTSPVLAATLDAANIPVGLRALAMQRKSIEDEKIKTPPVDQIPGEVALAMPILPAPAVPLTAPQQQPDQIQLSLPSISAAEPTTANGLGIPLPADTTPQVSPDDEQKKVEVATRKAQALATLIYYGLKDPNDKHDLSKAVHAMAIATGDEKTAVAMWQFASGIDPANPVPEAGATPDQIANLELLTQQQAEIQQAAAVAQYSQLWMQQQFYEQQALYEHQRLLASGELPAEAGGAVQQTKLVWPKGEKKPINIDRKQAWQHMLPGDWNCPGCGDHQFARNRVCRYCGTAKPC